MNEFGNITLYNLFGVDGTILPETARHEAHDRLSAKCRGNGGVSICRPPLGITGGDISLCCDSRISLISFFVTWFSSPSCPPLCRNCLAIPRFFSSWTIFASVNSFMSLSMRLTLTLTEFSSSSRSFLSFRVDRFSLESFDLFVSGLQRHG
ncbi:hypothetical protein OS493_021785 [Desmophyllum pertusum]|uniref:Uncharacterized protein n=1 Tax=Desmophyllum pertusum TaxID=174260 RepID=A0A9W9ZME6_9CNID|nr:hypothetical protein OS493_021785 [Desmophyllum pertusum]